MLPEAQAAAAQVVETGTNAGILIGQAWRLIYGREPNHTAGYDKAVRAVEAIVRPAIIPNDGKATLGDGTPETSRHLTAGLMSRGCFHRIITKMRRASSLSPETYSSQPSTVAGYAM